MEVKNKFNTVKIATCNDAHKAEAVNQLFERSLLFNRSDDICGIVISKNDEKQFIPISAIPDNVNIEKRDGIVTLVENPVVDSITTKADHNGIDWKSQRKIAETSAERTIILLCTKNIENSTNIGVIGGEILEVGEGIYGHYKISLTPAGSGLLIGATTFNQKAALVRAKYNGTYYYGIKFKSTVPANIYFSGWDHFTEGADAPLYTSYTDADLSEIIELGGGDSGDSSGGGMTEDEKVEISAMNTQINTNKNDIAALQTSVAGKADTEHKHSADDITSGTLPVANGGTGQTTANAAANAFINSLTTGESVPEDNDYYVSQYVNGGTTTTTYHRRPVSKLWEYIKGKISSVLGLTKDTYGGKSETATTAGSASKLTTARTAYVDLGTASTTRTIDWSGDTTIPVDGTLQVEHGGTGATTAEGAANSLISSLPSSQNVPVDSDYFISQVVNGGPFVPGYERRPISKLWEYIKGKISQEGEEFGYDHIVHDGDSLLEWANCTDGSMKKVLIKSGTYNITKSVDFSQAGTGYVLAENGAVINSHVPIAFTASSGKTVAYSLNVVCDGAANGDNTCAFSASNPENLILYDCSATYRTYTEIVNRDLFVSCTCYNCSYAFQNLPANSSISVRVFYQCRCYNCKCLQTIEANSSTGISFYNESYFYKECHCASCDAELTTSRNIKAATNTFACYYNCYDRCVGCLSKINVSSKALTVYSTLYGFLRCQYMSSCKETHTEGYSNIKGIVQCDFISSTSGINGSSNTHVGNSSNIH